MVKNYAECGILYYFRANKLARYYFMDAGRRHKTLELETQDLITYGKSSSQSFMFGDINFPRFLVPQV